MVFTGFLSPRNTVGGVMELYLQVVGRLILYAREKSIIPELGFVLFLF